MLWDHPLLVMQAESATFYQQQQENTRGRPATSTSARPASSKAPQWAMLWNHRLHAMQAVSATSCQEQPGNTSSWPTASA